MMSHYNYTITLSYRYANNTSWHNVSIAPADYFDDEYLDEGETPNLDSAVNIDDELEYLQLHKIPLDNLVATKFDIRSTVSLERELSLTTFWNSGNNKVVEVTQTNSKGDVIRSETILTIEPLEPSKGVRIIRFGRDKEELILKMDWICIDNPDGSETETSIPLS